jgi:3D (Asp-Asp-Asp) domain-containing protein
MIAFIAAAALLANSTSYCLSGTMADGTQVRDRSVAMNSLPLGSKIKITSEGGFFGRRIFYVRDRIGHGSQLDFWSPSCAKSRKWGRRNVRYVVIRRGR